MFNSSLLFELAVMKDYAQPILSAVPHDCPEYAEAHRLLRFLGYFQSINQREIPPTSLLSRDCLFILLPPLPLPCPISITGYRAVI